MSDYIELFCPDCYSTQSMSVTKILVTKRSNIRINCVCSKCGSKWSLTRRKGILNKIRTGEVTFGEPTDVQ